VPEHPITHFQQKGWTLPNLLFATKAGEAMAEVEFSCARADTARLQQEKYCHGWWSLLFFGVARCHDSEHGGANSLKAKRIWVQQIQRG
jgi:hypothetical protein